MPNTQTFFSQLQRLARYLLSPLTLIFIFVSAQMLHGITDLAYIRSEIADGAVWRLLSGQLIHNNTTHLLLNIAGILAVWLIDCRDFSGMRFALLSLIATFITGCLLYVFERQLHYYLGFSGALHGIAVVVAARLMTRGLAAGYLLGTGLFVKLVWEYTSLDANTSTAALIGLRVATEAHLWGAISGLLIFSPLIVRMFYQRATTADRTNRHGHTANNSRHD